MKRRYRLSRQGLRKVILKELHDAVDIDVTTDVDELPPPPEYATGDMPKFDDDPYELGRTDAAMQPPNKDTMLYRDNPDYMAGYDEVESARPGPYRLSESLLDGTSEIQQFSSGRDGKKFMSAGKKIRQAANHIRECGENQSGKMRRALYTIYEFTEKYGAALSEIGTLDEGMSSADTLPTTSELKKLYKEIKNLEKVM